MYLKILNVSKIKIHFAPNEPTEQQYSMYILFLGPNFFVCLILFFNILNILFYLDEFVLQEAKAKLKLLVAKQLESL